MSRIIFDSGISLDGFFAGDNRNPKNPMGVFQEKFIRGCLINKLSGIT